MDAPLFLEAGIIDYFTHMLLLWIWWHITIEEPGKEQKKLTGVIRLMQQMANVERDEDRSIVVGSEGDLAGRDKVRDTGLPGDPPCYRKGTECSGEDNPPPIIHSRTILNPYGIGYPSKIVHWCTVIS
jgi:hypothetical protein